MELQARCVLGDGFIPFIQLQRHLSQQKVRIGIVGRRLHRILIDLQARVVFGCGDILLVQLQRDLGERNVCVGIVGRDSSPRPDRADMRPADRRSGCRSGPRPGLPARARRSSAAWPIGFTRCNRCRPGVALPSLPLSVSPGLALASAGDASSLALELLLDVPGTGLLPAPVSPGNGNSLAASFFTTGVELELASGACGMPLRLGASEPEVDDGPIAPAEPGNGNFSLVLGLPGGVGAVAHGCGSGATEHGAGLGAVAPCPPDDPARRKGPLSRLPTHPQPTRLRDVCA